MKESSTINFTSLPNLNCLFQENNEILSHYARGEKETTADNAMNRDEYLRYQAEMEATKQTKESVCNFYTHS